MFQAFVKQAEERPERIAVSCAGVDWSYGELLGRIRQRQAYLRAQHPGNSSIAVFADNSIDFLELLLAVPAMGRVLTIINSRADLGAATSVVTKVEPGVLFLDESRMERFGEELRRLTPVAAIEAVEAAAHVDEAFSVEDPHPDDPAWLIQTSGTTSVAKGVVLPNRAINISARGFIEHLELGPESRLMMPFSLSHVTAHAVPAALAVGARLYLQQRFNAREYLETIERERITLAPVAPAMIHMLLDEPVAKSVDVSSLTHLFYGSSSISEKLLRSALQTFPNAGFVQAYGLTETCGAALWLNADDHRRGLTTTPHLLRATGRPSSDFEVKLVDATGTRVPQGQPGELLLKGPQLFLEYFNDAESTKHALDHGWFHTGDVAVEDEEGYFSIVDRLKDMVVTGGENVSSQEVERVLLEHPAVDHAATFGLPHDKWGEMVVAAVVMRKGATATTEEIIEHARETLAGYKVPRKIIVMDELPRNATGKVLKHELKAKLSATPQVS